MKKNSQAQWASKEKIHSFLRISNCYSAGILFLFLTNLFTSCNKDLSENQNEQVSLNSAKEVLRKQKFDIAGLIEMKDHYVVEGDIMISKKMLGSTLKRHAIANPELPISIANQNDIKIYFDNTIPATSLWRTGMNHAIAEYNYLNTSVGNSNLRFREVSSLPADIIVSSTTTAESGNYWAVASFPYDGKPGNSLLINFDHDESGFTYEQKKYVMMHELGHCIGFRHTDWSMTENFDPYGNNIYGAYWITNTPYGDATDPDPSSLFRRYLDIGSINQYFTYWDKYAISSLYPFVGVTFSVIVTNSNPSQGYTPSVNFFDPVTNENIAFKTFYSSYNPMSAPAGRTYNLVITQTNNKPLTVSVSGYPTKTGQTVTYNNVYVGSDFPTLTINNPTQ